MLPMLRQLVFIVSCIFTVTLSSGAMALGLGEVELKSYLNQPLLAEIELVQVRDLTQAEIIASMATLEDFERAGVDRTFFISSIQMEIIKTEAGRHYIQLTTKKPVKEPFLNFLIEVLWPAGRLLREYTLLVDPVVYAEDTPAAPVSAPKAVQEQPQVQQPQAQKNVNPAPVLPPEEVSKPVATPTQQPVFNQPVSTKPVPKPTVTSDPQPVLKPSVVKPAPLQNRVDQYSVKKADSLWLIASAVQPGDESLSVQQMMLAIQDKNPEAFIDNNINLIKKGQVLRIPTETEARRISPQEAIDRVKQQNALWRQKIQQKKARQAVVDVGGNETVSRFPTQPERGGSIKLDSGQLAGNSHVGGSGGEVQGADQYKQQISNAKNQMDLLREKMAVLNQDLASERDQLQQANKLIEVQSTQIADLLKRLEQLEKAQGVQKDANQNAAPDTIQEGAIERENQGLETQQHAEIQSEMPIEEEEVSEEALVDQGSLVEGVLQNLQTIENLGALQAPIDNVSLPADQNVPANKTTSPAETLVVPNAPQQNKKPLNVMSQPEDTVFPAKQPRENKEKNQEAVQPNPIVAEQPVRTTKQTSLMDLLLDNLIFIVGAVAALVILIVGFIWWRGREENFDEFEEGESEDFEDASEADNGIPEDTSFHLKGDDTSETGVANSDDTVVIDDVLLPEEDLDEDILEAIGEVDDTVVIDDDQALLADDTDETSDLLGEADIYLAYGRFEDAQKVLEAALNNDPSQPELYLKLLEVHAEQQSLSDFENVEQRLHAQDFSADFSLRIDRLKSKIKVEQSAEHQEHKGPQEAEIPGSDEPVSIDELPLGAAELDQPSDLITGADETEPKLDEFAQLESDLLNIVDNEINSNDLASDETHLEDIPAVDEMEFSLDSQVESEPTLPSLELPTDLEAESEVSELENTLDDNITDIRSLQSKIDAMDELSELDSDIFDGTDEASTKLDLAKAYIEMGDWEGAREILDEVVSQGSDQQKEQAKTLLAKVG